MSVRKSFNYAVPPISLVLVALVSACVSEAIEVSDAWARATVPGQKVAGAYMKIRSPFDSKLVAVASQAAQSVEIHSMSLEGGMMQMRRLEELRLPANEPVSLEPTGFHLMLLDLKKPLNRGEKLPLVLTFERENNSKQTLTVSADVRESGQ
jgi:copper(I)-binding protein